MADAKQAPSSARFRCCGRLMPNRVNKADVLTAPHFSVIFIMSLFFLQVLLTSCLASPAHT